MLKVELHAHTADDPHDSIPYSTTELIDHAAALGYDALAITLHDKQLDITSLRDHAARRRLVLIPGIERTIEGKHVLLLNFPADAENVRTFTDLERLKKRSGGLVVAPHPFFPSRSCLWSCLDRYKHLFDAVECNAMFTREADFNRLARRWARNAGKPIVGNCDVHRLRQLGTTYSLVDADRDPGAICQAIAAGRVSVVSHPLTWREALGLLSEMFGWRTPAGPQVQTTPAADSTNISLPQNV
jgi:predicted metal-dependent phosphoesterase TrpH